MIFNYDKFIFRGVFFCTDLEKKRSSTFLVALIYILLYYGYDIYIMENWKLEAKIVVALAGRYITQCERMSPV